MSKTTFVKTLPSVDKFGGQKVPAIMLRDRQEDIKMYSPELG